MLADDAADTLRLTYQDLATAHVDSVILVADGSRDDTVQMTKPGKRARPSHSWPTPQTGTRLASPRE